jgi:hypothetical protein
MSEVNEWKVSVIDALISCEIYNNSHEDDPNQAIHDLINYHVIVELENSNPITDGGFIQRFASFEFGVDVTLNEIKRLIEAYTNADGYVFAGDLLKSISEYETLTKGADDFRTEIPS